MHCGGRGGGGGGGGRRGLQEKYKAEQEKRYSELAEIFSLFCSINLECFSSPWAWTG